ncbi:cannabinoid receptor type 1A-like [Xenia sp. Carnegie-2017]|uniref:cannabinoid receptor type 1A-like n=1 Tax=Xenia sp. Carnegie-2017 TaxID=2897299 RepID=UPI001F033FDA|nr:cannabinoid receptor type 1A-like [Xenia sp. Carnegie-2017]
MSTLSVNQTLNYTLSNINETLVRAETERCFETYIVLIPNTSYIVNSAIGCVVNGILAVLGTFLNALVVSVFWKTAKLRNKVTYFMIMLLCCIDLCVTVVVHPFHLVNSIAEMTQTARCAYKMIYHVSTVMLSGMSYLTFFVMNVERYLSICRPFFHMRNVTRERCLMTCIFLWAVCIVTAVVPLFGVDIQIFVTTLSLMVLGGTFFIYVSIYRVANSGLNSRAARTSMHQSQDTYSVTIEENTSVIESHGPGNSTSPKKAVSFLHDIQLAKMYLIVVFSTILLNLPNALVLALFTGRVKSVDGVVQVKIWTLTLVAMNSTFNSLIFFWANDRLRDEGKRLTKKFFKLN